MTARWTIAGLAPLLIWLLTGAAAPPAARFTADGALIPPTDYREWVFLSSGVDMSYSERPAMAGQTMFDNVFVDPVSWAAFKASGHWPDGTTFVLENRGGASHGSINRLGQYQEGNVMGMEVHVRDTRRFQGGWGFFDVDGPAPARLIPYSASCYACHQAHGAVETTFTQFYPTAKPIAMKAGTYQDR
jgi:hypothetical protein